MPTKATIDEPTKRDFQALAKEASEHLQRQIKFGDAWGELVETVVFDRMKIAYARGAAGGD